jgi:hypothetical protein
MTPSLHGLTWSKWMAQVTNFGFDEPVRSAENRIQGSDQQGCSPGGARDDHRSCVCGSCSFWPLG